ncbi:MAG: CehA/McbA family metallohydrolase [Myxococcota bacterium]
MSKRTLICLLSLLPMLGGSGFSQAAPREASGSHKTGEGVAATRTSSAHTPRRAGEATRSSASATRLPPTTTGTTKRAQNTRVTGDGGGISHRGIGWYRGDLHFHSNYSDDALEQGGDWVGPALRIAEYYEDPVFQATFTEYVDNHLDFVALTDHRTVEGTYDLDFRSEKLILIPGEEFGSTGHAGALNISSVVLHDPVEGRTPNEQIQWAIDNTKAQGGLFSINHPAGDDDLWFWDVSGYESAEVWNMWVSLAGQPTSEAVLDGHVANYGVENRFIRRAMREEGKGIHGQYRAFYEAHLVAGVPLAAVGGGDRHMLVLPGHPTTYVQAAEPSSDGLIEGIRARKTFVSRSPAGPQVLLGAKLNGVSYEVGARIPAGATVTVTARVARANRGLLRIISGPIIRGVTRDQLLDMYPLGDVIFEVPIAGNDFSWQGNFVPSGESWFYAEVLESADYSDLPPDVVKDLDSLTAAMQSYGMRYPLLAYSLLPFMDPKTLAWPLLCKSSDWDVNRTACVDVDDAFMGTIHISEPVDRILNLYREDNQLTEYALGAVSSAITVEL